MSLKHEKGNVTCKYIYKYTSRYIDIRALHKNAVWMRIYTLKNSSAMARRSQQ